MTKDIAIKASEILDRLAAVDVAIEDLHSRDSFYNLPRHIFNQLEDVLLITTIIGKFNFNNSKVK